MGGVLEMIQNAFPEYERQQPGERLYPGMTLRDYFAAVALQGIISGLATELLADSHDQVAGDAYRFADAMLRARETQK
jgi:hypothetical protein